MDVTEQPRRRGSRILRFFLYLVTGIMILAGGLVGAIFIYEDDIKDALVQKLNKGLKAEVRIAPSDIDITFFRTFPQCAIDLNDVLMLEATRRKERDTLLYAERISLRFSVYDLWHRNYVIRGLSLHNGVAKPVDYKDGTSNYEFWEQQDSAATDSFQFRVDNVRLNNVRFLYRNFSSQVRCRANINSVTLKGDFSKDKYEMLIGADVRINELNKDGSPLLKDKTFGADVKMLVEKEDYRLKMAEIRLNDLTLDLNGGFNYGDGRLRSLRFNYNAPDLQIASLLSLVPARFKKELGGFESTGRFFVEGDLAYAGGKWRSNAAFGASKVSVTNAGTSTRAEDLGFTGSFSYGERSFVEVRDLSMKIEGGTISGRVRLDGFSHPTITLDASVNASLNRLQEFFQLDTITELQGRIGLNLHLAGEVEKIRNKHLGEEVEISMNCRVDELLARFKHDTRAYTVSHCEVLANNRQIEVRDLLLKRGGSDVLINGRMPGLLAYLMGEPVPLEINGSLASAHFDFADFMGSGTSTGSSGKKALIPKGLLFNVNTTFGEVRFGKFMATDVSGLAEIRDQKILVSDMQLRTMEGKAIISAYADNSKPDRLEVSIESKFRGINVKELFAQMNDFGQTTLVHEQLKGYAAADLDFAGVWNNSLESDPASIKALCDLTIDKGELLGFSPLQKLGRFVDVKELDHIRFSTLAARVEISDSRINIPRTSIKNSAVNLEFWGSHTFDHMVDYHFQLLLSDLIAAKRKKPPGQDEFGAPERDPENRRSAFIVMTGPLDNPKIRYDRSGLQQKIKNDIKEEKKLMGKIIREEFGSKEKEPDRSPEKQPAFRLEQPETKPVKKTELVLKKKEEDDF